MGKAAALAEAHGVDLGIEPELANVVNSADAAKRLLNELASPRLRIVLDPANLFETASEDERPRIVAQAVEMLAGSIAMAHAKDRDPTGGFVAAGGGVIDFPHFFACLRQAGFDGPLVTHGLSEAEAPGVSAFLKKVTARMSRHEFMRDGARLSGIDTGEGPAVIFQHGLGGDEAQVAAHFPEIRLPPPHARMPRAGPLRAGRSGAVFHPDLRR